MEVWRTLFPEPLKDGSIRAGSHSILSYPKRARCEKHTGKDAHAKESRRSFAPGGSSEESPIILACIHPFKAYGEGRQQKQPENQNVYVIFGTLER